MTSPRVQSSVASSRTLKRRSDEIGAIRDIVSKGAPSRQLQYEVKAQTKEEREAILDAATRETPTIVIPAGDVIAMKADLSLAWSKLREMRRYVGIPTTHVFYLTYT